MMTFEGCLSAHCELRSLVKDGREGLCRSWVTTVFCGLEAAFPVKKKLLKITLFMVIPIQDRTH